MLNFPDSLLLVVYNVIIQSPLPQHILDPTQLLLHHTSVLATTQQQSLCPTDTPLPQPTFPSHIAIEREKEEEKVRDIAADAVPVATATAVGGDIEGEGALRVRMSRVVKATEAEAKVGVGVRARARVRARERGREREEGHQEEKKANEGRTKGAADTTEDIERSHPLQNDRRENKNR